MTKVELYAIGISTTLESNKSLAGRYQKGPRGRSSMSLPVNV